MFAIKICYFSKIRIATFQVEFPKYHDLMEQILEDLFPKYFLRRWQRYRAYLVMDELNVPNDRVMIFSDRELDFAIRHFRNHNRILKLLIWFDEHCWPAEVLFFGGNPVLILDGVVIIE